MVSFNFENNADDLFSYLPKGDRIDSLVKNSFDKWKYERTIYYVKKFILNLLFVIAFSLLVLCCFDMDFCYILLEVFIFGFLIFRCYYYFSSYKTLGKLEIIYCKCGIVINKKRYNTRVRSIHMINDFTVKLRERDINIKTATYVEYNNINVGDNVYVFAVDDTELFIMKKIDKCQELFE